MVVAARASRPSRTKGQHLKRARPLAISAKTSRCPRPDKIKRENMVGLLRPTERSYRQLVNGRHRCYSCLGELPVLVP